MTIQVHVCCMKYNTFSCILAPQRRETWLEYLWELTDCCCCKFRWKALEISPSLFMMLWLLGTRCSICTYITPCFVQTGPSIQGFNPIDECFLLQADGSNQPQFCINREEGALQILCFSMLQTLLPSHSYRNKQTLFFTNYTKISLFFFLWMTDQ